MDVDFTPFFNAYERLRDQVDAVFDKVKNQYPDCVVCKLGCADCCHALFDLTLIEALYLHHKYHERLDAPRRYALTEKANQADRQTYKIKRQAYKRMEAGDPVEEILTQVAEERVRCPLLNESDRCDLYEDRPITCRLYGIPTAIGGKGHTCGLSGFKPGEPYPTVNMDQIQQSLLDISSELTLAIKSRHKDLAKVLVPVSMAMLTVYDDAYLGVGQINTEAPEPGRKHGGKRPFMINPVPDRPGGADAAAGSENSGREETDG